MAILGPLTTFPGFKLLSILRSLGLRNVPRGSVRTKAFQPKEVIPMLWTIVALLLILWLLGMISSYTLGGFIHLLLVVAVIVVLVRLIQGRPVA
jgi:Family of unknown function (DUF5670)